MARPQLPVLCVDGRMLGPGGTGVGTYARAVAAAQRAIGGRTAIFGGSGNRTRAGLWLRALLPLGLRAHPAQDGDLISRDPFRLAQVYFDVHRRPLAIRPPFPGGIMHWTYPVPLRMVGWHNLYTVHDAIPLLYPALTPIASARARRLLMCLADEAARFITVSEAARADIATALDLSTARITNCSQPVAMTIPLEPAAPFGLTSDEYLLMVGSVEPRKNIATVINAFQASGTRRPLLIAGPSMPGHEELEARIARTPGVARLAYVAAEFMPALIGHARALLMPSLAEGFGLPVAEAMTLGTSVITSNTGALAETAGDAALAVDPGDSDGIAAAIRAIDADDALARRLAEAGRKNARRFTPELFSAKLLSVYEEVAASIGHGSR